MENLIKRQYWIRHCCFLFYPNINAYKAVIVTHYGLPQYYEVPLEQHKFLNGAFYFAGWENPPTGLSDYPTASPREQRIIDLPNKIYTSEINNPFHFPGSRYQYNRYWHYSWYIFGCKSFVRGTVRSVSTLCFYIRSVWP